MNADFTTHGAAAGKSILVICCGDPCMSHMRRKIVGNLQPHQILLSDKQQVNFVGGSATLLSVRQVETQGRSAKYDEIRTCGDVYISERIMHMLQARLVNPRDWPGYFSKFP